MTPREKLDTEIVNLLKEFEKETGVAVEVIRIGWNQARREGHVTKDNYMTDIEMEMK